MKRSTERILTTHVGRLQRPDDLTAMMIARQAGEPYDRAAFGDRLRSAVADIARQQADAGITVVNDGEFARISWGIYSYQRLSGYELTPITPAQNRAIVMGKDRIDFADYYNYIAKESGRTYYRSPGLAGAAGGIEGHLWHCTGPVRYIGQDAVRQEIESLKAAAAATDSEEMFMTATAPSDISHFAENHYYPDEDAYVEAIGNAMREEYRAITDAGIVLQIDDPLVPARWDIALASGTANLDAFLRYCGRHIDILNHALEGIPEDRVRYHICWGSHHGPHSTDIALAEILPLLFRVRASGYVIEAGNVRHEHEWQVWKDTKLPTGKVLIPGVVSHATNTVEHPDLIAWRIGLFASVVGRENVIAGTDCGMGYRVHPQVGWAKLQALGEGARRATKVLFG